MDNPNQLLKDLAIALDSAYISSWQSTHAWNKLDSWKNWKEFLKNEVIIDEYGEVVPYDEFVKMIETYKSPGFKREDGHVNKSHYDYCNDSGYNMDREWVDEDGYSFTSVEFS